MRKHLEPRLAPSQDVLKSAEAPIPIRVGDKWHISLEVLSVSIDKPPVTPRFAGESEGRGVVKREDTDTQAESHLEKLRLAPKQHPQLPKVIRVPILGVEVQSNPMAHGQN